MIRVRENWYRDVWLLVITVVVVIAVALAVRGSDQAQNAARLIQAQRVETIRTSCEEQNRKHDATLRELHKLLSANARGSRVTELLIDQLAPHQDCAALVIQATRTPPRASLPPIIGQYPPRRQ